MKKNKIKTPRLKHKVFRNFRAGGLTKYAPHGTAGRLFVGGIIIEKYTDVKKAKQVITVTEISCIGKS